MAAALRLMAIFSLLFCSAAGAVCAAGARSGKGKKTLTQKYSEFKFFWHDVVDGDRPTSVMVIRPVGNASAAANSTGFGLTRMIDNVLTEGPEVNSTKIGRAQGLYASTACTQPMRLLMAQNFVFSTGKYNGSTLSVLGSNEIFSKSREMPVVGGTGLFRFATGYVLLRTHWLDNATGDACVEYTVHVMHY